MINNRILITGSSGLIGRALRLALHEQGYCIRGLDIRASGTEAGDVCHPDTLRQAIQGCAGVIHLAAVSRVVWGERDPEHCEKVNIGGVRHLIDAALQSAHRPWLVFASSREVYGQAEQLPVPEEAPLRPVNVYARTKVAGERLMTEAREHGLQTSIVRFSNVFGSIHDHPDRVVPAFARAAALGKPLRVEGSEHTFDFTHVQDVADAVVALVRVLQAGPSTLAPIHFVTGQPTTLGQLANLAIRLAGSDSPILLAPERNFDVARFYGCPQRAQAQLGWTAKVSLEQGLAALIQAFRADWARQADTASCA